MRNCRISFYINVTSRSPPIAFLPLYVLLDKRILACNEVKERRVILHDDVTELLDGVWFLAFESGQVDGWVGWGGVGWEGGWEGGKGDGNLVIYGGALLQSKRRQLQTERTDKRS